MPVNAVGARVPRSEDPRLLRGEGEYVADLRLTGALHAGFVRSPHAHARIRAIDLSGALVLPDVVAAYSHADLPEFGDPTPAEQVPENMMAHGYYPLARDTVRFVGEPVAVVLAEDPYVLADALDAVLVDYEPLPAVLYVDRAQDNGPAVWEDAPGNVAASTTLGFGDVDAAFETASVIIEERFTLSRAAGAAMEPRAVLAAPGEGEVRLTIWDSTQAPHAVRDRVSSYLGLGPDTVRVIAPDVGGGFGVKGRIYPEEYVVAALALRLNRPVRFVATRTEDLLSTAQGRGQVHHARLAAGEDGTILAIQDRIVLDLGAYSPSGMESSFNTPRHLMGPYRVPALRAELVGVYTNKVMISALRGGGRPEGIYVVERLLDRLAERLGMGRAEIRRHNMILPDLFPYDTHMPSGQGTVVYDSGNYLACLERALEEIGYTDFRHKQEDVRLQGRYLGLGLAAFVESTGTGAEGARVEVGDDGTVRVFVGSPSQGQGHATTFAQMVADRLGARLDSVSVTSGDTRAFGWGTGTFASRMGQYGGNAVSFAAREVRAKALRLASDLLEIAPQDLEIADGRVAVRGLPERNLSLGEVAGEARRRGDALEASRSFAPSPASTWASGVNAAIVEVDVETGQVRVVRYVVVHDSGTLVNPLVVEGQIHGGVMHGIGNALFEECIYSDDGQLQTATLADYSMPSVGEATPVEIVHFETPSPFNPEGIKGAGEGGTIGAIPTIVSAVEDALSPFGITINDVPMRPEEIVQRVNLYRIRT